MRKCKNRKIFAMILAASMIVQCVPSVTYASEETSAAVSQRDEVADIEQETVQETKQKSEQKAEQEKETVQASEQKEQPLQGDDLQANVSSDTETQTGNQAEQNSQTEGQTEPDAQTETDQEGEAVNLGLELLEANEKVSITSSEAFINLSNQDASTYQNAEITITRGAGVAFDLTKATSDGKTFQGFGSKEYPFKGTIKITNAESGIEIPVNHSFFNYLDQSAKIDKGLYLKAGESFTAPLLAENFVNDSKTEPEGTLSLIIDAAADTNSGTGTDERDRYSFGGLIGNMAANTKLSLSVENKITDKGKTKVSGTGNLGFFCNTMEAGASLTIASYKGDAGYVLSTETGHAGGLVGEMKSKAKLTVIPELTLEGSVQTTDKTYAAGGLVGKADTPEITSTGKLTCKEIIKASGDGTSVGGYIGNAVFKETKSLDFANLDVQATLGDGSHAGGLFGVLNYDCTTGDTLTLLNAKATPVFQGTNWQSGGLIGQYTANSLKSALSIPFSTVTITHSGTAGSFGGVIGYVAGNDADSALEDATAAYVEINTATVTVNAEEYNSSNDGRFGGLVAEMGS